MPPPIAVCASNLNFLIWPIVLRGASQTMWTTTQLRRELMDYWKLLTEGPLHASEEAAAADLKNDSKSKLVRYGTGSRFFLYTTRTKALNRSCSASRSYIYIYICFVCVVVRRVRRLLPATGAKSSPKRLKTYRPVRMKL